MKRNTDILEGLQSFVTGVSAKLNSQTKGEPEDQLRSPFEVLIKYVGRAIGRSVVPTGETHLSGHLGKPDYAIHANKLLTGYAELKAPGTGAKPNRFSGHNREQWKRFQSIPNLLYSDGNEWGLYRTGELVRSVVRLSIDIETDRRKAVNEKDAQQLFGILIDFLEWEPIPPKKVSEAATQLAPLCRMLRDDVTDALKLTASSLVHLAADWRKLLFPEADDARFADAYAQTVTFALLLGRSEGADPLTLESAEAKLELKHGLLSRALQVLTDKDVRREISASLELLLRTIGAIPPATLTREKDPWLYFYEDFLAAYDPKLRKDAGAYYTPVEVVRAQVRLIDDLLVNKLGKPLGFADPGVVTLDPAAGTGTYLIGVVEHALGRVGAEQGAGAVPAQATALAANLYGFELMVGPYAVSELRLSRSLADRGATIPADGVHVYLTDTLESPNAQSPTIPLYLKPIAEQHLKALKVKSKVPVIVCLGNPPYDRHDAFDIKEYDNLSRYGGWVRFGDELSQVRQTDKRGRERTITNKKALLEIRERSSILFSAFVKPAILAGHGVHVKNLYNLYVYFWRWALWKVFEHESAQGPGVVSFISASSYLDGDAFCGMREHMRRVCDDIWILDLGGEGRGARKSHNVFAIQTPVAITVGFCAKNSNIKKPATVHYASIEGTRAEKLAQLDAVTSFVHHKWQKCPDEWQAEFRPIGKGSYFQLPLLTDLMPWQHSGAQFKRTWPISFDTGTLKHRWHELLTARDLPTAFKETRDRKADSKCPPLLIDDRRQTPIDKLPRNAPAPGVTRYAYRSFDRQWILADNRLGDFLRPDLWNAHSDRQVYLASAFTQSLSIGPSVTACAWLPDLHYYSGRGAKDIVPLYRSTDTTEANVIPGLVDLLGITYERTVTSEELLAYIYGVLAHAGFTERFSKELGRREVRVPITKSHLLFDKARRIGSHLLWLHTYGERFVPKGKRRGEVPRGNTKCTRPVPGNIAGYPESFTYNQKTRSLYVGEGEFRPVNPEVFAFEVSGLKVVQSWLRYRMKKGAGKKSSPLDDIRPEKWTSQFTTELLELLWVLEATLAVYPEQAKLLAEVVKGPCFTADEIPPIPESARKPPRRPDSASDLFDESADVD